MNNKRKVKIIKKYAQHNKKILYKISVKSGKTKYTHTQREKYVNIKKYASKYFMRILN